MIPSGIKWLFPHPGYEIHFRRPPQELYAQWREAKLRSEPEFIIENIRFEHDPDWNKRLLSIQSAHDGNHWVWWLTRETVRVVYAFRWGAGIGWL